MKISIENLKAQMSGRKLTIHQKADALVEFNKLIDYVNKLENELSEWENMSSTEMIEVLKGM